MKTPRKGLSAGFSSKKGLQELQRLALRAPMAMGVLLYLVNNMGRSNALAVSQGAMSQAGDQCSCRCWSRGYPLKPQLHRGCEGGQHERLPNQQPCGMAGKRGERFAAFNAEILAFERAAGRLRHSPPLKSVPNSRRGTPARGNEELPRQTNRKWICHESAPTSRMLALAAR